MTAQAGDTASLKSQLRREYRRRRAEIPEKQRVDAARHAARELSLTPLFRRTRHLALYLGYGSEIDTRPLIELSLAQGKCVYVPKIVGEGSMQFVAIDAQTRMRRNRHGIDEPLGRTLQRNAHAMDLILLPLTAFDAAGRRLGTGGGCYDRALDFHRPQRRPAFVGYAYALQEAPALPAEPWDIPLDAVVTEHGFRHFRN